MKCHYEILEVPRNVSDEELKKAYRKLALKWHPDKNPDNPEEAKEQFQLVQQAWEVLSDPHERAWYDNHREAILKGGIGEDYKDDSIDLFQYFSTSCFKGYNDDEKGFYTVYRTVFERLAAENAEFAKEGDSDDEPPSFGDSQSSYEDVHLFYAYWQSYSTKRSYAWLDPHDIRYASNRRILRLIEKRNKKVRDKAKRERNEQVRNLVAFVRKRDKRVQAHAAILAERAKENVKKMEERKRVQLLERQKQLKEHTVSEWSKFSNIEAELKSIEADLAAQFGEELSSDKDSEEDEVIDDNTLYCVACNKIFKTHKAFTNHENSKKHKDNVASMKESMVQEDQDCKESSEDSDSDSESVSTLTASFTPGNDKKLATDPQLPDFILNPNVNNTTSYENEQEDVSEGELISDEESDPEISKRGSFKAEGIPLATDPQLGVLEEVMEQKNEKDFITSEEELISDQEDEEQPISTIQKKKKKRKKNIRNPLLGEDSDEEEKVLNEDLWLSKKQRKKQQQKKAMLNKISTNNQDLSKETDHQPEQCNKNEQGDEICSKNDEDDDVQNILENSDNTQTNLHDTTTRNKNSKAKDGKKVRNKVAIDNKNKNKKESRIEEVQGIVHCCVTCKAEFPSKNKLFEHLKKTGHSVYIPNSVKHKKNQEKFSKTKGNSEKRNY